MSSPRYALNDKNQKRVTLIPGDGIGPEVVEATRRIIDAAGVQIAWEEHHAGASIFKKGIASGVPVETIESIQSTRVALKGPLETPVGFGEKSANVTLRKLFETYGNLRPVRELPGVKTPYSGRGIDFIIVRENVEDLYAGIEHMQTPGVAQCLKIMSRKGCEKIVRLAFEVARAEGRNKVHCATKANIMKLTEGLMKKTFEEISREYSDIEANHIIIDNCAHQLVRTPEQFQVIVTSNMNGDILSDLGSGLIGGLGFAPGANVGNEVAIFEAVHGSAPKYAGKDVINPSAMLMSGLMMLRHLDEFEAAEQIERALMLSLEQGAYTRDVRQEGSLGTKAFTDRVIQNLKVRTGQTRARKHLPIQLPELSKAPDFVRVAERSILGADIFVESSLHAEALGKSLETITEGSAFRLKMISNRGTKIYPLGDTAPDCVDHWRCRFVLRDETSDASDAQLVDLLQRVATSHRWMHVEKLQFFDGKAAFTKAQGED
jgi:isocitrate dehydrogenase